MHDEPESGRSLRRSEYEHLIDAHRASMATDEAKQLYRLRVSRSKSSSPTSRSIAICGAFPVAASNACVAKSLALCYVTTCFSSTRAAKRGKTRPRRPPSPGNWPLESRTVCLVGGSRIQSCWSAGTCSSAFKASGTYHRHRRLKAVREASLKRAEKSLCCTAHHHVNVVAIGIGARLTTGPLPHTWHTGPYLGGSAG